MMAASKSFPALRRFFRAPKGLLILILALLVLMAALGTDAALIAPGLLSAAVVAVLIDAPILRFRDGKWSFPDGALLTGLLVAMIVSAHESWHVVAFATAIGVVSKYLFRSHTANVFNPAAFALLAAYGLFHPGQSWWGALPELAPAALNPLGFALLFATGAYIASRVNRLPAVLAFLGIYFLLFTLTAYLGDPGRIASIYRESDLHAVIFFAFFMVTDPPTSPTRHRDQIIFGAIVAVLSYAVFKLNGAVYYLLPGLLAANGWEAFRRARQRARRHATSPRVAA